MQWFLKMSELAKPALENVENDTIKFFPEYKNTYRHWMENNRIGNKPRQLWWGHRILRISCLKEDLSWLNQRKGVRKGFVNGGLSLVNR